MPGIKTYQQFCFAEKVLKYIEPKRDWKTEVLWIHGLTGIGNSKLANELAPGAYWLGSNSKWWDGYDGHEDVIIDDFRCESFEFNNLLRLLDRYPYRIETKGGTRQFLARRIIITSHELPKFVFRDFDGYDINRLLRRVDTVMNNST